MRGLRLRIILVKMQNPYYNNLIKKIKGRWSTLTWASDASGNVSVTRRSDDMHSSWPHGPVLAWRGCHGSAPSRSPTVKKMLNIIRVWIRSLTINFTAPCEHFLSSMQSLLPETWVVADNKLCTTMMLAWGSNFCYLETTIHSHWWLHQSTGRP